MKNKIIVDKIPGEPIDCVFGKMDYSGKTYEKPVMMCQVDGYLCDLECDGPCDKLITFEEISRRNE